MLTRLKSLGAGILGLGMVLALVLLVVVLLNSAEAVSAWAYPFLVKISAFTTVVLLPLLLLMALVPASRGASGAGLVAVSYVYGVSLWIWALLYTLQTWGWLAVIIGLLMAGVGVVPIAVLAALFHTEWSIAGQLILMLVFTFGCRIIGALLAAKAQERAERLARAAA